VGDWRRLHNVELHNLRGSENIIAVINTMRMTYEGNIACMEEMRNAYNIIV
jgi:hypothetical protein